MGHRRAKPLRHRNSPATVSVAIAAAQYEPVRRALDGAKRVAIVRGGVVSAPAVRPAAGADTNRERRTAIQLTYWSLGIAVRKRGRLGSRVRKTSLVSQTKRGDRREKPGGIHVTTPVGI